MTKKRIVSVGMGFGGIRAARVLAGKGVDVLLVDRNNYHLFQPLLYQVATAGLKQAWLLRELIIYSGGSNIGSSAFLTLHSH